MVTQDSGGKFWDRLASSSVRNFSITAANLAVHSLYDLFTLLARERHPDGILYSSKETHYGVFKAARYYRMDAKAIPTLPMGEIDYDALASEISKNRDRPVIINVTPLVVTGLAVAASSC